MNKILFTLMIGQFVSNRLIIVVSTQLPSDMTTNFGAFHLYGAFLERFWTFAFQNLQSKLKTLTETLLDKTQAPKGKNCY